MRDDSRVERPDADEERSPHRVQRALRRLIHLLAREIAIELKQRSEQGFYSDSDSDSVEPGRPRHPR